MPRVEVTQTVLQPVDKVWKLICDMEAYPRFMPSVEEVTVLDKIGPLSSLTRWRVVLKESIMEWVEEDEYLPEHHTINFRQREGDLERFDGNWALKAVDANSTAVNLLIDFDIGIPALAEFLDPIAVVALEENCRAMLTAIDKELMN